MNPLVQKSFLQTCMNHSCLDMNLIKKILEPICQANDVEQLDEDGVRNLVKSINGNISQYQQQLTFVKHPLLEKEFLVFGYTMAFDVSKFQAHYSDQDRLYFRMVLDAVAGTDSFGMTWIEATNLTKTMQGLQGEPFSKNHAQSLLRNWIKQGYYIEKDEKLFFGPRLIVEFASHLRRCYPEEIKDCSLCGQILLWGDFCAECDTSFHRDCIRKFIGKSSLCPSCRKTWKADK